MSEQTEQKPEQKPEPKRERLLHWHAKKGTKRDLLCIAVVQNGWDFLQEPGSMAETMLTEEEFDQAIEGAKTIYTDCVKQNKKAYVISHREMLIAIIVRKPLAHEVESLSKLLNNEDVGREETEMKFKDDLMQRLMWPKEASEQMAYLLEEVPAFFIMFPQRVLEISGMAKVDSKKVG